MSTVEDRLKSLESRMAALEVAKGVPHTSPAGICKKCGACEFDLTLSRKDPHFGIFGETIDEYKCKNCDFHVEVHSSKNK